ncbi:MAG: ribosome small subunit-dependent GTPase A [Actinomycetota bacterium]
MSWLYEPEPGEHDLDESDVRIRPNPKGNRPRTKIRPDHESAKRGFLFAVDKNRYQVLLDDAEVEVNATLAKELRKDGPVVGDRVLLTGDTSGIDGALARIVGIEPRESLLRRSADDSDQIERVIVANATQLMIVVAAANPEPRTRLIDRYLAAAYDANLRPILCITKTDLADPEEFLRSFRGLSIPVVQTRSDSFNLDEINRLLAGENTVLVGHSGVGKSTLVNAIAPEANRAVGKVNDVTGRGRHTSTSVRAIRLPSGWIIDTPGIRSFGLGHIDPKNLLRSFEDLWEVIASCPRGCSHLADSPDCELDAAVASGTLGEAGAARVDSLRRLMTSLG